MGYRITSIMNIVPSLDTYVFLIGDYRYPSPINNLFRNNFNDIADRFGINNALIERTGDSANKTALEMELVNTLEQKIESKRIKELLYFYEGRMPGILILRKHPKNITSDDSIVFIPFEILDKIYGNNINRFVIDFVDYVNKKSSVLLDKISDEQSILKRLSRNVEISIPFGIISLNLPIEND